MIEKATFTLEDLLHEKQQFDLSLRFEKAGIEDERPAWLLPGKLTGHTSC